MMSHKHQAGWNRHKVAALAVLTAARRLAAASDAEIEVRKDAVSVTFLGQHRSGLQVLHQPGLTTMMVVSYDESPPLDLFAIMIDALADSYERIAR